MTHLEILMNIKDYCSNQTANCDECVFLNNDNTCLFCHMSTSDGHLPCDWKGIKVKTVLKIDTED